ncbi:NAD(P)-binding oxidoreductase [Bacillus sp. 165]|uniref:NAD(P)-dependent oxidoreductase n=1 Tax=Bacillus sp. 165 TaxID=1529117 RepID=UPI001ADCDA5C|nr:NAD(P)-binding oxidoreductase [Bacillus sp. 165]MBO9131141.1 SDR family oxidoreductase [Bacillus sp. 165]
MKIIVFGAAGRTGKQFVQQALDMGYIVTAFVRTPSKLGIIHENLKVVQGDALNQESVVKAISSHDAVISCLGGQGLGPTTELEEMTANIVAGMKQHNVERVLYVASAGIYKEISGIVGWLAQRFLKNVLADHRHAVNLLEQSELAWTIARPMGLIDKPVTGQYRITQEGVPKRGRQIARADVAHFLLYALSKQEYIKESIGLAY